MCLFTFLKKYDKLIVQKRVVNEDDYFFGETIYKRL